MTEISASLVKELREETGVGMMECKKALVESNGDKAQAIKILRERGMAIAGKKASRAANQGLITAYVSPDSKLGVMIEINSETDFVARNEVFQAFVGQMLEKAKSLRDGEITEATKADVAAKVAEIGENIVARRNVRYELQGAGAIASYIHMGGKVGVLLELGCGNAASTGNAVFKEVAKDLTLHIAASNPSYLKREDVPAEVLTAEREIYAKQVEGKPAQIIGKIVDGKVEKFYGQVCFVEQAFVKDPNLSITQLLEAKGKELGDTLVIRRFVRYQLGV